MLENNLEKYRQYIELQVAPQYAGYDKALFLGKHISYPFALESALKLKEIAYVFAESHASGELKHGSLALVDENVPVFIFSHQDNLIYQKLLSNAHAVCSRGGNIIAFAYEGQDELCALAQTYFVIPNTLPSLLGPLVMTGLMQFLMYCIARERGCPIDKPRNLAKSVTVE
jgi:glucosamine--fructose-6-phosphate aminotransferase (isomerizing)